MGMNKKQVLFIFLFTVIATISTQINFSKLIGAENQFFTLFQFIGPIAGGFLGAIVGALMVLISQLISFAMGKELNLLNVLRLLPLAFAAFYFGSKDKKFALAGTTLAIIVFVLHPTGRQVWYFTLFWLIPFVAALFPNKLFSRSLGSTFSAHAIGGMIWILFVPSTPAMWIALIPVVIFERLLFTLGISVSYVLMNTVLAKLESVFDVKADWNYVISKKFFSIKTLSRI